MELATEVEMTLKQRPSRYKHSKAAPPERERDGEGSHVHTSRDGRKFIRSDEIIRLKRFQRQLDKLDKIVQGSS
ncbi:MAG TPA: hypothetical protein VJ837_01695 [Candidatus Paceibacterota bacterium]|nr:hypothetical protein [Candidatus Paceibacterota bacterium]